MDNIRAAHSNGRVSYEPCRDVWSTPTAPWGWTSGGYGGGMTVVQPPPDRAVQRPAAQYHLPNSYSWMKRTVQVPVGTTAALHYDYYVDSEANDYMYVLVNGQVRQAVSGAGQSGHGQIDLSAGANTIVFAYQKDGTGDGGLDLAAVDNVRLAIAGQPAQNLGDFRGAAPFAQPFSYGWTSGGSPATLAWQVRPKAPHISDVDAVQSAVSPLIDGRVQDNEYSSRATGISLFRYRTRPSLNLPAKGPSEDDSTRLVAAARDSDRTLYLVLMAKSDNSDVGNESGDIYLYLDEDRMDSLSQVGCAAGVTLPGDEDRKIKISYSIPTTGRTPAPTITQWQGTCTVASPWAAVVAPVAWPVAAAATESVSEGIVTVEVRITLPQGLLSSRTLGLGLTAVTPSASLLRRPTSAVHLPYAHAPQDADVLTWETLGLAPWRMSDAPMDGCCSPGLVL